jgi:hypothetical protein
VNCEYRNLDELVALIRDINKKYYNPAVENIIYLEELKDSNFVIYIAGLRDAYCHLVSILDYDNIFLHDNKTRIQQNIIQYSDHLQRILFDTYQKIVSEKARELWMALEEKDKVPVKAQVARELKRLRIVDQNLSTGEKIEGYRALIKFIENIGCGRAK